MAKRSVKRSIRRPKIQIAPLSGSFMVASIVGFLISSIYIYDNIDKSWGLAFSILFVLMFVASVISMTYGPADQPLIIHYK